MGSILKTKNSHGHDIYVSSQDLSWENAEAMIPYHDNRGYFLDLGDFKISHSFPGVARGLHFQYPTWQTKKIRVLSGSIYWFSVPLKNPDSFKWGIARAEDTYDIPLGNAHGFVAVEPSLVIYKTDYPFILEENRFVNFEDFLKDKTIRLRLPQNLILSEKDMKAKPLAQVVASLGLP